MLTTLSVPTSVTGRVRRIRRHQGTRRGAPSMGLTGQAATVDELLHGARELKLIGRLYGLPKTYIRESTEQLLEGFSLTEAADRMAKTYSGGMRRSSTSR
jgi:ABC-2 type transport system ATP-binding protein